MHDGPTLSYGLNNRANEYSAVNNKALTYDAAGSLTRDEKKYHYYYDFENRLVEVRRLATAPGPGPGPDAFGMEGAELYALLGKFAYDALGRRIRATYYDGYDVVTADTLYYYDDQRVLAEFDYDEGTGEQSLLRYFADGPLYVDEHLVMYDATTGQDYYYLLQELYTVAGLVDENGDLVEAYAYDAYGDVRTFDMTGGSPVEVSLSTVGNPYRFTGRRLDAIPNPWAIPVQYRRLYHYRAREYDPPHGRFLQRDPAEYADTMNLYVYALSSPLALTDPFGRQSEDWPRDWPDVEDLPKPSTKATPYEEDDDYRYRAFTQARTPWRKLAPGQLEKCPRVLSLPDVVEDPLREALRRTAQTGMEWGGAMTYDIENPENSRIWGPIRGSTSDTADQIYPSESIPYEVRRSRQHYFYGRYHTHTYYDDVFSGQDIMNLIKERKSETRDSEGNWTASPDERQRITILRTCRCTRAVVLTKATPRWYDYRHALPNEKGLKALGFKLPRRAQGSMNFETLDKWDADFAALLNKNPSWGICYYKRCADRQQYLSRQGGPQ